MKIRNLVFFAFSGAILSGFAVGAFILSDNPEKVLARFDQDRDRTPEIYESASMSEGTILLLLAVGVIGALGVSRKRQYNVNIWNCSISDHVIQPPGENEDRQ